MITTPDFRKIYTFVAGASVPTYPITFTYQAAAEVFAELTKPDGTNVPLTQGVDFSVTAGPVTLGTFTKIGTWDVAATQLTIYRVTPQTNTTDLVNGSVYDADTAESSIDELTQMIQELQGNRDLALVGSITDPSAPGPLPTAASRSGRFLAFDASGDPIASDPTNVPVTAYMKTLLADVTDIDARTTLDVYSRAEDTTLLAANRLALIKTTAVDYTILDTDGFTDILASGTTTITLPAVANNEGRDITILNSGTGAVTLSGTIDGAVNPTLDSQYDRAVISARGGVWYFKDYLSHGSNSNGSWVKFGDGTITQRGWGYVTGNGTGSIAITVTLPYNMLNTTYDVSATSLGFNSTNVPASRADVTGPASQNIEVQRSASTAQINLVAISLAGAVLAVGSYILFSFVIFGSWK